MGLARRKEDEQSHERRRSRKGVEHHSGCHVVLNGNGVVRDFSEGCLRIEDLTYGAKAKALGATVAIAEPGASCWEATEDAGEKWYYILEGKLEVLVNQTSYFLGEGDSIYLESSVSHVWRNPTGGKTKALVLSSPL
ncbi:MAG: cupin domain-containing protein [Candidatus Lindowbacteria bacterium]|nr:cupin domain-containing protein [Candidatus Lindowbacteria bacterium]